MTSTGRQISEDAGVPSLPDMALGLSRVVRFGGQGRQFFSVAQHTLWLDDLAVREKANEEVRLALLLHDGHEALVGDIPSPFKMLDQKKLAHKLDERIFDVFFARHGGYDHYSDKSAQWPVCDAVKMFDWRGLLTEYAVIGPAHKWYLEDPKQEDRRFLEEWISRHARSTSEHYQQEWIKRVVALM